MPFAVELDLDDAAAERVLALCRSLEDELGIATINSLGARPHVSLAVYDAFPAAEGAAELAAFAASIEPMPIAIASLGCFPASGVVFLAPVMTAELLALHRGYHGAMAHRGAACWEHYRPGHWVPHVTIAMDLDAATMTRAAERLAASWEALPARLVSLGLIEFRPVTTRGRWKLAPARNG